MPVERGRHGLHIAPQGDGVPSSSLRRPLPRLLPRYLLRRTTRASSAVLQPMACARLLLRAPLGPTGRPLCTAPERLSAHAALGRLALLRYAVAILAPRAAAAWVTTNRTKSNVQGTSGPAPRAALARKLALRQSHPSEHGGAAPPSISEPARRQSHVPLATKAAAKPLLSGAAAAAGRVTTLRLRRREPRPSTAAREMGYGCRGPVHEAPPTLLGSSNKLRRVVAEGPSESASLLREKSRQPRPIGLAGQSATGRRRESASTASLSTCNCKGPGLPAGGNSQPPSMSTWCRIRHSPSLMVSRTCINSLTSALLDDCSPTSRPHRPPLQPLVPCLRPPTMTASRASAPLAALVVLMSLLHLGPRPSALLRLLRPRPPLPLLSTAERPRRRYVLRSCERLRRCDVRHPPCNVRDRTPRVRRLFSTPSAVGVRPPSPPHKDELRVPSLQPCTVPMPRKDPAAMPSAEVPVEAP